MNERDNLDQSSRSSSTGMLSPLFHTSYDSWYDDGIPTSHAASASSQTFQNTFNAGNLSFKPSGLHTSLSNTEVGVTNDQRHHMRDEIRGMMMRNTYYTCASPLPPQNSSQLVQSHYRDGFPPLAPQQATSTSIQIFPNSGPTATSSGSSGLLQTCLSNTVRQQHEFSTSDQYHHMHTSIEQSMSEENRRMLIGNSENPRGDPLSGCYTTGMSPLPTQYNQTWIPHQTQFQGQHEGTLSSMPQQEPNLVRTPFMYSQPQQSVQQMMYSQPQRPMQQMMYSQPQQHPSLVRTPIINSQPQRPMQQMMYSQPQRPVQQMMYSQPQRPVQQMMYSQPQRPVQQMMYSQPQQPMQQMMYSQPQRPMQQTSLVEAPMMHLESQRPMQQPNLARTPMMSQQQHSQLPRLSDYFTPQQKKHFTSLTADQKRMVILEARQRMMQHKEQVRMSQQHLMANSDGVMKRNIIQQHIQQQGSLGVQSLKGFMIGPSCVGKTTTLRRLTHEIVHISPDEIVPSTGIDAPITVQLYRDIDQSSVLLSEGRWRTQGLGEQCRALCSRILNSPAALSSSRSTIRPSTAASSSTSPITSKQDWENLNQHAQDELVATALTKLVKDEDWKTIQEFLKNTDSLSFIHFIDIGGQPEFHEILPLLLHGMALNLIFFNVNHDLDSLYTVVYRADGPSSIQYESEYTIREIIQRALCSISSLQTSPDHKPAAILIGTHLDQTSEAAVLTLDHSIQQTFQDDYFMKRDVLCSVSKPGEEKRYIYPLNNVSADSSDIKGFRELITKIVHERFTPQQVPTGALLLHLILRMRFDPSPGWCSIEECVVIAECCGISREDLLGENGVLQYLHDKYGTILYYGQLKKLGKRVIVNVNLIMKPPAELFASAFGAARGEPETAKHMRRTGEVSRRLMNKACSESSTDKDGIPTDEIVELLESCYILYKNVRSASEEEVYFLPCLLYPDHIVTIESSNSKLLSCLLYSPLLLVPVTGFVPLGHFQASVVRFSQNKNWSLDEANRFRNRIRFYFHDDREGLVHVEIRSLVSHIEVRILTDVIINPRLILECRCQLWTMFCEVGSLYSHTRNVHWDFGFYCPHAVQSGRRPHPARCRPMTKPQHVICSIRDCQGGPVCLENEHKFWFTEVTELRSCHSAAQLPTAATGRVSDLSRAFRSPLSVNQLLEAVDRVTEWHSLGRKLGLTMYQLRDIELSYRLDGLDRLKAEMFDVWLRSSPNASWTDLITALRAMNEDTVVSDIFQKLKR